MVRWKTCSFWTSNRRYSFFTISKKIKTGFFFAIFQFFLGMDVLKKIESFGSAPKGIVKQKLVIVDCGSAGEGVPVGPPPPPPCPKVFFDMTAGKTLVPKHFLLVQTFWPRPKIELH
jgi:hypothetical protein